MNTKIETASKINFFGDMIGSPVFIFVTGDMEVAETIRDIILKEKITDSIKIDSLFKGAPDLVDRLEREAFYPDIIICDDWVLPQGYLDYLYIKEISYFTLVTIDLIRNNSGSFENIFDYVVDNRGSEEMLKSVLTGIVKDLFRKEIN